ncbi:Hypothetical predicted protein [Cloeon dipterum]|nr:Hypothetical predicted protein [Cloeon dipterum]
MPPAIKNIIEIESQIFQKANGKEEYIGYLERIILHVRRMRPNPLLTTVGQMLGQQPQQGMMPGQPQTNSQQGQMTSPAIATFGNSDMAEEWRTSEFRHKIIENLHEEILISGISTTASSNELESIMFENATNKVQYMVVMARFILHVRLMSIYAVAGGAGASFQRVPQEIPDSQNPGGNGTDPQALSQSQNASAASDVDIIDLVRSIALDG